MANKKTWKVENLTVEVPWDLAERMREHAQVRGVKVADLASFWLWDAERRNRSNLEQAKDAERKQQLERQLGTRVY